MDSREKAKSNHLLNIDNFTGEHGGRMAPMLIFIVISVAPFFLWMLLSVFLPFKIFMIFEVLWVARWALFILGKENSRLEVYRANKKNAYESAKKLVRVAHNYEDGLFEYMNGKVAYCISCEPKDYLSDERFTYELEMFLKQLEGFDFDIYLHNIVDENRLEDSFDKLTVYKDKKIISERIEVLTINDSYCRNNTSGYRFNVVVKSSKYSWKKLKQKVESVIISDYAKMFNEIYLCGTEQVSDVMSRDILTWLDLEKMLQQKYENEEYYGSQVMFYGDDIPDKYKVEKEVPELDKRRRSD